MKVLAGVLLSFTISVPPTRGAPAETMPVNALDDALSASPHPASTTAANNISAISTHFIFIEYPRLNRFLWREKQTHIASKKTKGYASNCRITKQANRSFQKNIKSGTAKQPQPGIRPAEIVARA